MSNLFDILREQRLPLLLIIIGVSGLAASFMAPGAGILILVPIAVCGIPIICEAVVGVVKDHDITADVLVSVAIAASIVIGEYEAAAEVSIIMQIGTFLEEATVSRASSGISSLLDRRPSVVRVVGAGGERIVDPSEVSVGDIVRVMPGETFPVDGRVVVGSSSMDASMITGESIPVDVAEGDAVYSGTVNMFGSVDVEVERAGDDSTLSRMARLIEEATSGRSRVVRTADRWARYIVVIAFAVSVLSYAVTRDIYRSVTVLMVFCPCALVLATPTAILAASGNLSRRGVLVKDCAAMENIAKVDVLMMDKTGTLTTGDVESHGFFAADGVDADELSVLVASLESRSEHPLGRAIAKGHGGRLLDVDGFEYFAGKGVSGTVDGRRVVAGNRKLMDELCPDGLDAVEEAADAEAEQGFMVVYAGIDGRTVGFAKLSDTVRTSSLEAVEEIRGLGLETIMLTGDSEGVARRTRGSLGMDDAVWECLPEDKLRIVSEMEAEHSICMVGDGVNDAPSLKRADVGVAMGGVGSDMALDAADLVIMDDDVSKVAASIRMGRRTLLTIKAGISFSLILNTAAMGLAVLGLLGPVAGALVHNIGSVMVIIGAAMLLRYDCWSPGRAIAGHARPEPGRVEELGGPLEG